MTIEKIKIPFEANIDIIKKYDDNDKWYVEGYAATTDYDDQGDIITQEALKQSEKDLLERSTVLFNHDKERPIGKVEEAVGDNKGLRVKVLISKTEPDIWQKIQEGVINKFSIRGAVIESVKEKVKQAGKDIWANIIKAMKLIEVSLVSIPANSNAKTLAWYMSKALDDYESSKIKSCELCGKDTAYTKEFCLECESEIEKAVWTTAYVNDLPDSCFAYIEPGGKKDGTGKTTPRSLRHLPYKDKDGKPDAAHVRNALARLSQTNISSSAKARAKRKLVAAARDLKINISEKCFTFDEIDEILKENDELKGMIMINGQYMPHSRMLGYSEHIKGLKDRKLGEEIVLTVKGSIKSLESDDDFGDTCLVDIKEGEFLEVEKSMSDIKKKDGTIYTQEEIDALETKIDSISKELEEVKAKSKSDSEAMVKKEADLKVSIDSSEKKVLEAETQLAALKKELDEIKAKNAEAEINANVEKKWSELEGKAYKKEDASAIKPILKKGFMKEALTPEETDTLISRKIQGSILKLGLDLVAGATSMTKERKEELISFAGIKIKKNK